MDNTLFPSDQQSRVTGTNESHKVPKWTNLKILLQLVTSRASLDDHIKLGYDSPCQVARIRFAWQTIKEHSTKQTEVHKLPRNLPMHEDVQQVQQCRQTLLKYRPTWALNSHWVVQYYRDPGARHHDQLTSLTTASVEEVVPSHQGFYHGRWDKVHQRRIIGVRLLLNNKQSRATQIRVEQRYACILWTACCTKVCIDTDNLDWIFGHENYLGFKRRLCKARQSSHRVNSI